MQPAATAAEDLRQLLALQRNRAEAYNRGFRKFLIQGNDNASYQELVKQLTSEFGAISTGIRAIEARLRSGQSEVADCIIRLQASEKEKLVLTAKLHLKRREVQVLEAAEDFVEPELQAELRELREEMNSIVENINELIDEFQAELQELVPEEP